MQHFKYYIIYINSSIILHLKENYDIFNGHEKCLNTRLLCQ